MGYDYSEHISDIGIIAVGASLEEAFEEGVKAMLNVMFSLDTIEEKTAVEVSAVADGVELLFVEVLNEALSLQGVNELALKRFEVLEIKTGGHAMKLVGKAFGERFERGRHEVKTEVKGATYSGLSYERGPAGEHILRCILDV